MGTSMFKLGSFEEEIYSSMKKNLVSNQLDDRYSLDKIAKAADYINNAAELLDASGFKVEAEMLTGVLKRLANEENDENEARNKKLDYPEEIIIEPLDQEIAMPVFKELGAAPLAVDFETNKIYESAEEPNASRMPQILEFNSIAQKIANKLAAKKKV